MDDVKIFYEHCDDKDLVRRFFNEKPSKKTVRQLLWDLNTLKLDNNDFFRLVDCCGYLLHSHYSFSKCRSLALQWKNQYIGAMVNYCKFFSLREKVLYLQRFVPEINVDDFFITNYPSPKDTEIFVMKMEQIVATHTDANNEKMKNIYLERKNLETDISIGDDCFSFIIPKSSADILKEARDLKICIMARFQQYIDKELIYCFMRDKKDIDKPLVSIIIDARTNKILWAIKENHVNVDGAFKEAVDTWYNTVFCKA